MLTKVHDVLEAREILTEFLHFVEVRSASHLEWRSPEDAWRDWQSERRPKAVRRSSAR